MSEYLIVADNDNCPICRDPIEEPIKLFISCGEAKEEPSIPKNFIDEHIKKYNEVVAKLSKYKELSRAFEEKVHRQQRTIQNLTLTLSQKDTFLNEISLKAAKLENELVQLRSKLFEFSRISNLHQIQRLAEDFNSVQSQEFLENLKNLEKSEIIEISRCLAIKARDQFKKIEELTDKLQFANVQYEKLERENRKRQIDQQQNQISKQKQIQIEKKNYIVIDDEMEKLNVNIPVNIVSDSDKIPASSFPIRFSKSFSAAQGINRKINNSYFWKRT